MTQDLYMETSQKTWSKYFAVFVMTIFSLATRN